MANRIENLSVAQFVESVKAYDTDLYNLCVGKGIDVAAILEKHKPQCDLLSIRAGVSTGRAALQKAYGDLSAEYKTGVIVGSTDRYNSKGSMKLSMLCPGGENFELSTFDTKAKIDGKKVDIVYPAFAKIKVKYDTKWKAWNVLEFAELEAISNEDFLEALDSLAYSPGELGIVNEKSVVVVKGVISGATTSPIIMFDEEEDRYVRTGEFEVLEAPTGAKDAEPIPCLGFRLAAENDKFGAKNYVTVSFGKQRNGTPLMQIADLTHLCKTAVENMIDDPREQAILVGNGLKGMIVYAVGYMGDVGQDRDENAQNVNYIRLNGACIVETGMFVGSDGQIMSNDDFADIVGTSDGESPAPTPSAAPESKPAPEEKVVLPSPTKPSSVHDAAAHKTGATLSLTKIRNQIIGYCKINNVLPAELNVGELQGAIMDGQVPLPMLQVIVSDLIEESTNSGE